MVEQVENCLWQEVYCDCHFCHWWPIFDGRIVTAMTTLLLFVVAIAFVAIAVYTLRYVFVDGSHVKRQPPASHYPFVFDHHLGSA